MVHSIRFKRLTNLFAITLRTRRVQRCMCVASALTFLCLCAIGNCNCMHPLGMSDNVLASGGSTPTPIGELLLLITVGASSGYLQLNFIGHFLQATMLLMFLCIFEGIVICVAKYIHSQVDNGGE